MALNDHGYKQLFSHPEMVRDLLRNFLSFDWVQDLDFSTLEKLNNSYITDDLRERADDVVWKVKFGDKCLYLYLLIEFQSSVERHMAVRLLTYIGLLYQDLLKSKQIKNTEDLPPVLPLVLYNGKRPWNAALRLGELIKPMPEQLRAFQPELQYLVIDERRLDPVELERQQNLAAALFRTEFADGPKALARVVANLAAWLDQEKQASLVRAFNEWIGCILERKKVPNVDLNNIGNLNLMEMQNMLNVIGNDNEWGRVYLEKGLKQGIELGEARTLKRLLTKRFGQLPQWAVEQIDSAKGEQLESWVDRVLEADTLECVLG